MKIQSEKDTISFRYDKSKKAELLKLAKAKNLTESELCRQIVDGFLKAEKQQAVEADSLNMKLDRILSYQQEQLSLILSNKNIPEQITKEDLNVLLECLLASMPAVSERNLTSFKDKKVQRGIKV